jgi:transposase-like protein
VHRNAPLTPEGRLRLCRLIESGDWTVAAAAETMRISRQCAHKWWRRYKEGGVVGLEDRSSRPRRMPTKTPTKIERRLVELRRRHQVSAARLAPRVGVPASTLHAVWARCGSSAPRVSQTSPLRGGSVSTLPCASSQSVLRRREPWGGGAGQVGRDSDTVNR